MNTNVIFTKTLHTLVVQPNKTYQNLDINNTVMKRKQIRKTKILKALQSLDH